MLWNNTPQPLDVSLDPLVPGGAARVMDRFGSTTPLPLAADGHIKVTLAPATANTIPGYSDAYFIGGEPILLVEPLPDGYRPLAPTYANLPPPGQS